MHTSSLSRRLLVAGAATVTALAISFSLLAWRASAEPSAAGPPIVAPSVTAPPSTTPPTTVAPTTSTTTAPRQATTTVAPAPPTTVAKPVAPPTTAKPKPAPATTVRAAQPTTAPAATSSASPAERCAAARQWVAEHGVVLPAGWGFRCPGQALVDGKLRWGVACWNCEGAGSWIAVDIGRIGSSDATLRHVIAHEICHAIDYETTGTTTESGADACAAAHGAPRP